ncbi:conodipine-P1-like [Hydractinia symbiolongicarpus]|uniref:conodipine-P1-like n=1 Tax=Hydractinia symbiolongicarpus TaxID=13093 RepID=UPI00254F6687|nr:conodipine-P1-like [Hydractinia symbiolongicarpus]
MAVLLVFVILVARIHVQVTADDVDFKPCITQMTNGCSVPLNFPFPYKDVFLPACERHDICYQCGKQFNWTRGQCDNAFKANMLTMCKLKEESKYAVTYGGTFWEKLRSAFKVATAMARWILIKSGTLDHCINGSDVYYKGVKGFGHNNFGTGDPNLCNLKCSKLLGDPRNII